MDTIGFISEIADGTVDWSDWQRLEGEDLPGVMKILQDLFRLYRRPGTTFSDPVMVSNLFTGYARMLEALSEPTQTCWKCLGEQEVTEYISHTGFAGGMCYYDTLACGHVNADESDDVLAAM